MSKTCDDADIDYRKQYSAPAGALTMFLGHITGRILLISWGTFLLILNNITNNIDSHAYFKITKKMIG